MKPKEVLYVYDTVENEGFEAAFVDYSDFASINDAEFHVKRLAYLDARKALVEYLGLEDKVSI